MTINDDPNYVGVIYGGIDCATGYNVMIHSVNQPYGSFYVFQQIYNRRRTSELKTDTLTKIQMVRLMNKILYLIRNQLRMS
jgi:hypothetical protein